MFRLTYLKQAPFLAILVVSCVFLGGCGGPGGRYAVEGEVKLDGQPVDGGLITFLPVEGGDKDTRVKASGEIKDGKYSLTTSNGPNLGKYKVLISWKKKTGKMVDAPGDPGVKIEEAPEVIPDIYNTLSNQVVEIKAGPNTYSFPELKSKGKSSGQKGKDDLKW